ncbi:MAG: hypothetical protein BMS9Abin10_0738 [Gammaproteobacteria bacterium]|nr:MAG: hypothetical protein BMS9Abin10_0738 [Gammaproteobacteria bacterium]
MSGVSGYICTLMCVDQAGRTKYRDYTAPTLAVLFNRLRALAPRDCEIRGLWELCRDPQGNEEIRALDLSDAVLGDVRRRLKARCSAPL